MKRIFSLLLVSVIILTICPYASATSERNLNEEEANMYHTKMISYFEEVSGYPSTHGGAWLNQNSGHLVIGLTERTASIENFYYEITEADILEFETVEYSLNELYDAIFQTRQNMLRASSPINANGSAIIQSTNSVEIYISEQDAISQISKSSMAPIPEIVLENIKSNPNIVNFRVGEKMKAEANLAKPGEGFRYKTDSTLLHGSIGYIAYRQVGSTIERGFVTSAHTFHLNRADPRENAYNSSNQKIGTISYQCWADPLADSDDTAFEVMDKYGMRDYAFVKFDSGVSLNPQIKNDPMYTQDLTERYIVPSEGSVVHKSGNATAYTFGTVYSTYYIDINNYELGPVVKRLLCMYYSEDGDSGSIVYTRTSDYKALVVGIHQGGGNIGNVHHTLVIPAYNIQKPYLWRSDSTTSQYIFAGEYE